MRGFARTEMGVSVASVLLLWSTPEASATESTVIGAEQVVVSVSPLQVHQGSTVSFTVSGCTSSGTVSSPALSTANFPAKGNVTVTARVHDTAAAGPHLANVQCGGVTHKVSITVLGAGSAVQGGLGGSSELPSEVAAVIGGGLFLAAAYAGLLFIRRRRIRY